MELLEIQILSDIMQKQYRKGYGNPDGVSFWLVYTFFVQLSSLRNWCTLTRETSCDPATTAQLCGSCGKHPPSIVLLVIFSHGPFINLNVSLILACFGAPDLITVLFFSVSSQTIYYENANAISSLSPINLLLLLLMMKSTQDAETQQGRIFSESEGHVQVRQRLSFELW